MHRSFLRPALLAVALLALLAVVALASRADRPGRPGSPDARTLPMVFWDYVLTISLVVIVSAFVLALFLRVPLRGHGRRSFGFTQLLAIALISGLVALAGSRMEWPVVTYESGIEDVLVTEPTGNMRVAQEGQRAEPESRSMRVQWPVVFGTGALLLVGLGIYLLRRRRHLASLAGPATAEALSRALDDSLDDLRAERDPRRAVIAAYARMERVLEHHGVPRFRSEAPLEYLVRVLRELRVRSGAVLALTELFERAKFSRHEIDSEMKAEAIGALVAVRDDLREAA